MPAAGPGKAGAVGPVRVGAGPVGPNRPGTGPFRQAEMLPPPVPGPPPPPKGGLLSRVGDIPIKVVYLIGAIIATVAAVILVFVIFSGDVPTQPAGEDVARVAPVPSETPAADPSATRSEAPLPAAPAKLAFAKLSGKATATTGTVRDQRTGISYPRLGKPWQAKSFSPFAYAQRVGKAGVPQPVIASAMLPGETPESKPDSDADYRAVAARAARWTLRTQYPEGATLTWTGSQKLSSGKGWTLAFQVSYTDGGEQRTGHALVSVVEVGQAKPAMLMASIPESGKAYWRDLNTLAEKVRPL